MKPRSLACAFAFLALLAEPVFAQEREWSLDAAGEDAFLVFGVPQTDDVGLSFWCKIGSGKASVFYPVTWTDLKNGSAVKIQVEAGKTKLAIRGKATSQAEGGSASLEAPVALNSKLFGALKSADRVVLKVGTHKGVYPLVGADIDGLVRLCRQK